MSGTVAQVTQRYGYTLENPELICKLLTLYEFNELEDDDGLCIFLNQRPLIQKGAKEE